ncbi:MAG: GGDEF domain-containing protein, partial [Firmicutes bacterium]|nr:GGDEF domain-containing protein [Bacillota bacterium]
ALDQLLRLQLIMMLVFLAVVFLLVYINAVLVIRPLLHFAAHIRDQEKLPVGGAEEVRLLANTYNAMFEETQRRHSRLSYEASHDAVTGLSNRRAFEEALEEWDESQMAMIIVDVDNFKTFNDTCGHAAGDQVLVYVANALRDNFRSDDMVCRIGGDEFAVIMQHADSSLRGLVENKFDSISQRLRSLDNGLPPITLSVGVAFGDREDPEGNIYKDADKALYIVKERGRDGIEFF